ncbi:Fis family transcriptional regulator [Deltaproteobacteria bacterium Smac51]|nr:Fis family transcriptional regulator [Deltaproteobacteria bacterium Smac51]
MKNLSTDWRSELRKSADLSSAASNLARIMGRKALGAVIFLLDLSAENLVLYGLARSPRGAGPMERFSAVEDDLGREASWSLLPDSMTEKHGMTIPFGRIEDPLTFCLLNGSGIFINHQEAGPEQPSITLLRTLYDSGFSSLSAYPLRGGNDKMLGVAVVLDPAEKIFSDDLECVVDFGAIVIESLIMTMRHNQKTLEVMAELDRVGAEKERGRDFSQSLVGQSGCMRKVRQLIEKAARHRATVLLTGETGTGKELAAEAIHRIGREGPFVKIDCAAIPAHLLESELFGCRRGAFTGADRDREGLIAAADGGVVLLDEIGEMPLEMQAKILRLIQERQVRPVGGIKAKSVDVSFIAATNRDLRAAMACGDFRSDLYHRLAVFPIHMPPLSDRREDIPLLAAHFLAKIGRKIGRSDLAISAPALRYLYDRKYEGNVRELAACVERAVMMSGPEVTVIGLEHFTQEMEQVMVTLPEKMARYEQKLIDEALAAAGGNQREAAVALGIPRRTLSHKVRRHPRSAVWGNHGTDA